MQRHVLTCVQLPAAACKFLGLVVHDRHMPSTFWCGGLAIVVARRRCQSCVGHLQHWLSFRLSGRSCMQLSFGVPCRVQRWAIGALRIICIMVATITDLRHGTKYTCHTNCFQPTTQYSLLLPPTTRNNLPRLHQCLLLQSQPTNYYQLLPYATSCDYYDHEYFGHCYTGQRWQH